MGLRVDREAALGWLGIESFRPSGRVPLPAGKHSLNVGDLDEPPASDIDDLPVDDGQDVARAELPDAPVRPVAAEVPESTTPAEPAAIEPEPSREQSIQQESAVASPADRLSITAGSPHRALAEAIARVAGLACETGEGDRLTVGGETWELSTLAGDGQAKRRLWRVLAARSRRPRA